MKIQSTQPNTPSFGIKIAPATLKAAFNDVQTSKLATIKQLQKHVCDIKKSGGDELVLTHYENNAGQKVLELLNGNEYMVVTKRPAETSVLNMLFDYSKEGYKRIAKRLEFGSV
jgi:hypothetical protein